MTEEVDGRKTMKGMLEVVEVGVGVTEAVAVVTICALNAVAEAQS